MLFRSTSPLVPELVTEIDELDDLNSCVHDALAAVIELYQDMGRQFPANLRAGHGEAPVWFESLVMAEGIITESSPRSCVQLDVVK